MKCSFILILAFTLVMCDVQHNDKEVIEQFVKKVILDESYTIENIGEYIEIDKNMTPQGKDSLYKVLQLHLGEFREKLKENSLNYDVVAHADVKDKEYVNEYNLIYDSYDKVYYLINNEEIITFFIMEGGKIRAFFSGIAKKRGKRTPWLLNKTSL